MKHILLITTLFWVCSFLVSAQTSVNSSGITATGSGGYVVASVAQIFVQTESSPAYYLIQGVQQPYEVSVITSNQEYTGLVNLNVFPNPTAYGVTLSINLADLQGWNLIVCDPTGKTIQMSPITSDECLISLEGQATGTYFLKVFDKSILVKTFKVVKM